MGLYSFGPVGTYDLTDSQFQSVRDQIINSGVYASQAYQNILGQLSNQRGYMNSFLTVGTSSNTIAYTRPSADKDPVNMLPERAIDRLRLEIKRWHGDTLRTE